MGRPYPCSTIRASSYNISIFQEFNTPYASRVFNALNTNSICNILLEKSENRSTLRTSWTTQVFSKCIVSVFKHKEGKFLNIQLDIASRVFNKTVCKMGCTLI
jgi:hypothetical protein